MTGYCDKKHVPIIWDDPFQMSPCPLCSMSEILSEVRGSLKDVERELIEIYRQRDSLERNLDCA